MSRKNVSIWWMLCMSSRILIPLPQWNLKPWVQLEPKENTIFVPAPVFILVPQKLCHMILLSPSWNIKLVGTSVYETGTIEWEWLVRQLRQPTQIKLHHLNLSGKPPKFQFFHIFSSVRLEWASFKCENVLEWTVHFHHAWVKAEAHNVIKCNYSHKEYVYFYGYDCIIWR